MAWAPWIVPAITAVAGYGLDALAKRRQRKLNEGYLKRQNEYNSPEWQMMRYKQAGLNPGLIYSQGNPGNQSQSMQAPEPASASGAVQSYNQTRLADTQQAVGRAKVEQSRAMTAVNRLQADVLARNPLLNDGAFEAIIESLKSAAREKMANADIRGKEAQWFTDKEWKQTVDKNGNVVLDNTSNGYLKMDAELRRLNQQFNLGQADQAIKAQVLNSKEFENAMLEIQKNFITDGDIGPAQILEFVKLLLTRVKAR